MSVLAVSDLVFGDLLTELNLKPWWEKIRGYCFAAGAVCALFTIYITLSSTSINCIPKVAENTTNRKTISTTEANFINNYCFSQLPRYISIYELSPLCFSIVILLISSYWTMFPDVINSFCTFAQFEQIIGELNLTAEQLCAMSSQIVNSSSSDECKQLRKACFLLWKYKCQINIERCYQIRNWFLLSATIIILAISVTMLYFLLVDESIFYCFLRLDDEFDETIKGAKQLLCSHNKMKNLELFMLPFTISLLAQGVFTAVGISNFKLHPKRLQSSPDNSGRKVFKRSLGEVIINSGVKPEAQLSFFMIKFWKNSKPTSNGALEELVNHMFDKGISDMEPNLEKVISEDVEMSRLDCYYSGGAHAFWVIYREIEKKTFSADSPLHANIVQHIKHLKPRLKQREFRAFIDCLCEKKFWELLANVSVQHLGDWIRDLEGPLPLEINPNEIGQPYNLGRSFLYYFGKVASRDAVKTVLVPSFRDEFVHFDGKSKSFNSYMDYTETWTDDAGKAGTLTLTKGESSQDMIGKLCKDHADKTNDFKERFNKSDTEAKQRIRFEYEEYLKKLSEELSRYKFDEWDDITKKLAEFANDEKQWVLLVALFNAFIKDQSPLFPRLSTISSCEVNEFTLISEETQDISPTESILYYALTKPPYLKNFLFTAVHHILDCTHGQEMKVRKNDGTIVTAMNFVKKNEDLERDEREKLITELLRIEEENSRVRRALASSSDAGTSHASDVTFSATNIRDERSHLIQH